MFRAMLDTCVLFKPLLCDTLLSIAEEGLYLPLWSVDVQRLTAISSWFRR